MMGRSSLAYLSRVPMPPRLPPLALLKTFEVAARHLSFKRAAEELHVTPAAVSQQIRQLEDALGATLFQRLTRAVALTDAGATLLPGVRDGLDRLAEAVQEVRQPVAQPLMVTAPPSFASHWLLPRLPRFQAAHPGITLHLTSTAQAVDRHDDAAALARLGAAARAGRDEMAIIFGQGRYPGFQVDPVLAPDYLPVCAPNLPRAAQPLREPADLRHHALIHDETLQLKGGRLWGWADWLDLAGVKGVDNRRGLRLSNAVLGIDAALAGQGVLLAAQPLVAVLLQTGRLVAPFALTVRSPYAYYLVAHQAAATRPAPAAFRAWLLAEAGA